MLNICCNLRVNYESLLFYQRDPWILSVRSASQLFLKEIFGFFVFLIIKFHQNLNFKGFILTTSVSHHLILNNNSFNFGLCLCVTVSGAGLV